MKLDNAAKIFPAAKRRNWNNFFRISATLTEPVDTEVLRTALDGNFIAAMLTILGYSINDTVVVYDRIRENRTLMGKKASFEELVNHSVNQSARRTLITTITTVMALGVMCIVAKLYGLDSIFTFAFPLMMGMISGVYTSLCVSTSAWVLCSERKPKTKA